MQKIQWNEKGYPVLGQGRYLKKRKLKFLRSNKYLDLPIALEEKDFELAFLIIGTWKKSPVNFIHHGNSWDHLIEMISIGK